MTSVPKITPSEWEVMKLLWGRAPQTSAEIVETLSLRTTWTPKTIRTLINRLVKKGALEFKKEGRIHHYSAVAAQKDCALAETRSFVERVYGGALEPMLANFLEAEVLSDEEIEKLKRIIEDKERK